ncbi:MAG: Heptaprenyl diphosphate synthase component I [Firmicutes bacterium]|nr:Heptaprenyl diphosphate synthase component I [Bacillota bacterium]MDI6706892.1 Gx transporter family protein [Bacillota bacterium]
MKGTKKLAVLALFVSMALVLHVVENLLPIPYIAPGVKLGLANIVSLMTIIIFGFKEAIAVVLLRTFLGSLLGGVPSGFFFSAAGGVLSTVVMYIMYTWVGTKFSLVGISVVGAIAHNIGQLFVASLIVENFGLYVYLPVLMISAVITGTFIGITANYAVGFINKNVDYD